MSCVLRRRSPCSGDVSKLDLIFFSLGPGVFDPFSLGELPLFLLKLERVFREFF